MCWNKSLIRIREEECCTFKLPGHFVQPSSPFDRHIESSSRPWLIFSAWQTSRDLSDSIWQNVPIPAQHQPAVNHPSGFRHCHYRGSGDDSGHHQWRETMIEDRERRLSVPQWLTGPSWSLNRASPFLQDRWTCSDPAEAAALRQWLSWKVASDSHQSTSKRRLTGGSFLPRPGHFKSLRSQVQGCHKREIAFTFILALNKVSLCPLPRLTLVLSLRWTIIKTFMYFANLLFASHLLDVQKHGVIIFNDFLQAFCR